jgi:hypothetical protein
VSLLKPNNMAGLKGGGILSFSRAREKFERPVCFDEWGGSPRPSDEAGFVGDDVSLGSFRFGSGDGFAGEEAGAFSTVLLMKTK